MKRGQVSRTRQASLAPRTFETLAELQRRRPQEWVREIPPEVVASNPTPVVLDPVAFSQCLSSALSWSSPGGCTYEMLKVCLSTSSGRGTRDCHQSVHDVNHDGAAEERRQGARNRNGHIFLSACTLARKFGKEVEAPCAPFQFALSTRAGTDCVGHATTVLTNAESAQHCLSTAWERTTTSSGAVFTKLHQVRGLRVLLPLVRSINAQPTMCVWTDTGALAIPSPPKKKVLAAFTRQCQHQLVFV